MTSLFDVLDKARKPKYEVVLEMPDTAVKALTGKPDPSQAWAGIIKPDDVLI